MLGPCGHTFCEPCLKQWFKWDERTKSVPFKVQLGICPSCGEPIRDWGLNNYIGQVLERYLNANPDKGMTEKYQQKLQGKHVLKDEVFEEKDSKISTREVVFRGIKSVDADPDEVEEQVPGVIESRETGTSEITCPVSFLI